MAELIPAILTDSLEEARRRCELVRRHASRVQLDILDGRFVETSSFALEALRGQSWPLPFELHLMIEEPGEQVELLSTLAPERVIVHLEAMANPTKTLSRLRSRGLKTGLALNPETPLAAALPHQEGLIELLLLGVHPGRSGQALLPKTFERVREAVERFPDLAIGVDGGVRPGIAEKLVAAGATIIVAASAIFASDNPLSALLALRSEVEG